MDAQVAGLSLSDGRTPQASNGHAETASGAASDAPEAAAEAPPTADASAPSSEGGPNPAADAPPPSQDALIEVKSLLQARSLHCCLKFLQASIHKLGLCLQTCTAGSGAGLVCMVLVQNQPFA